MEAGEPETIIAYYLFSVHHMPPSTFVAMHPAEKAIVKEFVLKEAKETEKLRKGRR